MKMKKSTQTGFTLVELLVVITILVLLAGVVGPKIIGKLGGAKSDTALVQIRDLEQALEIYMLDTGQFPTTEQGLAALVNKPADVNGWSGPYLKRKGIPIDPWNKAYFYRYPGEEGDFDIYSYGADGQEGGEDDKADIGSWQ